MKKRNRKETSIFIDLNERKNITIVRSSKKSISSKEMQKFEDQLQTRYNKYSEFTEFCIQKNRKNQEVVSMQMFDDAMKSMLEQNTLLKNMINIKEQEN